MKIAIISLGYLWFPCESGTSRFFEIANTFVNESWDVECITTSFQHFKKAPRDKKLICSQHYPFKITFIDAPAYKQNIDIRRVISNHVAASNLKKYLERNIDSYDAIYVSIPANNIAALVTSLAYQHHVPVVVDIEDLWPEAMSMIVKNEKIRNLVFYSFKRDAETTYKYASGIIGTSEDYTNRAFKNRPRNIPAETVYVGVNLNEFDQGVREYQDQIVKSDNEFWVTYTGSISTSYDIKTLIDAVYLLRDQGVHAQILGTGSLKKSLEEYSEKMDNIHFWGFTEYHKMAAVLSKSDVVVNSFVKGAPQSIVNKVGDYLASGKPMINTLENPIFCKMVSDNHVGINVKPENAELLSSAISKLMHDKATQVQMGHFARTLCEKEFDRKNSYKKIVSLLKQLVP